jgi:hypothetical protein
MAINKYIFVNFATIRLTEIIRFEGSTHLCGANNLKQV